MNSNELQKKVEALCNDAQFTSQLSACTTPAEVADLFTREGVTVSAEEMKQVLAMVAAPSGEELGEDALDGVSGGASVAVTAIVVGIRMFPGLISLLPVPKPRTIIK